MSQRLPLSKIWTARRKPKIACVIPKWWISRLASSNLYCVLYYLWYTHILSLRHHTEGLEIDSSITQNYFLSIIQNYFLNKLVCLSIPLLFSFSTDRSKLLKYFSEICFTNMFWAKDERYWIWFVSGQFFAYSRYKAQFWKIVTWITVGRFRVFYGWLRRSTFILLVSFSVFFPRNLEWIEKLLGSCFKGGLIIAAGTNMKGNICMYMYIYRTKNKASLDYRFHVLLTLYELFYEPDINV